MLLWTLEIIVFSDTHTHTHTTDEHKRVWVLREDNFGLEKVISMRCLATWQIMSYDFLGKSDMDNPLCIKDPRIRHHFNCMFLNSSSVRFNQTENELQSH